MHLEPHSCYNLIFKHHVGKSGREGDSMVLTHIFDYCVLPPPGVFYHFFFLSPFFSDGSVVDKFSQRFIIRKCLCVSFIPDGYFCWVCESRLAVFFHPWKNVVPLLRVSVEKSTVIQKNKQKCVSPVGEALLVSHWFSHSFLCVWFSESRLRWAWDWISLDSSYLQSWIFCFTFGQFSAVISPSLFQSLSSSTSGLRWHTSAPLPTPTAPRGPVFFFFYSFVLVVRFESSPLSHLPGRWLFPLSFCFVVESTRLFALLCFSGLNFHLVLLHIFCFFAKLFFLCWVFICLCFTCVIVGEAFSSWLL